MKKICKVYETFPSERGSSGAGCVTGASPLVNLAYRAAAVELGTCPHALARASASPRGVKHHRLPVTGT